MTLSLSSLLVVVVVVVFGTLTNAAPRVPYDVSSGVRGFPYLPGYPLPFYPAPGIYPSTGDYLGTRGEYPETSMHERVIEDFNRRVLEAQRRYHEDLQMLRRVLEEQGHPLRTPAVDTSLYFPMFPNPYAPKDMSSEEKEKDKKPVEDEVDDGDYSDEDGVGDVEDVLVSVLSPDGGDLETLFGDAPTPGEDWKVIPLLPEVPDADDLPDKYDNSTHTVHIINGSRVEVNTTTHKDSGDVVTTFFHTEVINILPDEPETEEDTTEDPVAEGEEGVTEETEGEDRDETLPEEGTLAIPSDLEELIKEVDSKLKTNAGRITNTITKNNSDTRRAREATEDLSTTPSPPPSSTPSATPSATPSTTPSATPSTTPSGPKTQHLAAYVKGEPATKGKGKDDTAPPRDLSGDTLVNSLPDGKEMDPDAEIISSEELH